MWNAALLGVGLLGLWLATGLVVRSAVALAERWGLSKRYVGLTLLAAGTDLPELIIAISGAVHRLRGTESSGVVVGNAIGSAIAQGSLVLGVAGLCAYLPLPTRQLGRDGGMLLIAIGALAFVGLDGTLGREECGLLIALYLSYLWVVSKPERRGASPRGAGPGLRKPLGMLVGGVALLLFAAELVVTNAVSLAEELGVSQTVLGVVVIAVGTSLPELALSIGAAIRGEAGLSLGNIIGSNIFDLLVPIGVSGVLAPLLFDRKALVLDLPFLAFLTGVTILFFWKRRGLQRREAGLLIVFYVVFALVRLGLG